MARVRFLRDGRATTVMEEEEEEEDDSSDEEEEDGMMEEEEEEEEEEEDEEDDDEEEDEGLGLIMQGGGEGVMQEETGIAVSLKGQLDVAFFVLHVFPRTLLFQLVPP
eukprot:evm.model.NODE_7059_length_31966_cov_21.646906.9